MDGKKCTQSTKTSVSGDFTNIRPFVFFLPNSLSACSFFGVGKKTLYKVLKDSQKEFVDLSQISCDDIETSVAVSRKFVARL
jgi:hypothetical protein